MAKLVVEGTGKTREEIRREYVAENLGQGMSRREAERLAAALVAQYDCVEVTEDDEMGTRVPGIDAASANPNAG